MNIKHQDIEIPSGDPFANCKLGRKKYATVLSNIVATYVDGFVLAIDNKWGSGKTTFVKMWRQQLVNEGFETLYFNAWESDYEISPLAVILAELQEIIPKGNDALFKSLLKKGGVVMQKTLPAIIKAIADKYINIALIDKSIEKISEAATEILKEEISRFVSKKKGIDDFKITLEKYLNKRENKKPLIFIIDEIDRCRPTYSVEILEQIKHLFSVKGIVFILSIDKSQLCSAIRGFYGSDTLDSEEYLRRFIDLEYSIPIPDSKLFCQYLYEYFEYDTFFENKRRINHRELKDDSVRFMNFTVSFFNGKKLTLRQQEKIFAHARVAINAFPFENYIFPAALLFLTYLHLFEKGVYAQIKNRELDLQQYLEKIEDIILGEFEEDKYRGVLYTEAVLLNLYEKYYKATYHNSRLLLTEGAPKASDMTVMSKCKAADANQFLFSNLITIKRERAGDIPLDYLLNKIDLLESLTI